jgi:capsular polysaccharide biosynthesis protein
MKVLYTKIRFILFRVLRITQLTVWIKDPRLNSIQISAIPEIYSLSETLVHVPTSSCFYRFENEVLLLAESNVWNPIVAQESYGYVPKKCGFRVKEPVVLVPTQYNYFHWLFEDLPSILNVVQFNKNISAIRAPKLSAFQTEVIDSLFNNQIILQQDWCIAEKLMLSPKTPINFMNIDARNTLDILRSTFISLVSPNVVKVNRIYIPRKGDNLPKEIEILLQNYLISEGFKIIDLEQLTFREQVNLFNSADFVVAPHGAGLSNLIWSANKVNVFEIFIPNRFNECYRNLSYLLGHRYKSVNLVECSEISEIIKLLEDFISFK